ncbi:MULTISPECIES: amidohydrolase family protein [unclassified Streptomyces]|uniref:amidohydrolase family protein n=1 Tax=unclassified Streptomyces TaxID=2593676 RepID=UPI0025560E6A|nr:MULTISPECIES: amidohydrolase family protein [unclassified Streptomyces]WRZ69210.1 amidohydrolase [Streptomyces sp. NBC_01257]
MIDCHVHLWDPARGFPWIKPGGEHHQVYGEDELERSGAGLGLTGAVLVEASRGDAGETHALRELRLRRPDLVAGYVANLHVHGEDGPDAFRALLHGMGGSRPAGMRLGGATWDDTPEPARALVPVLAGAGVALELNLHRSALRAAVDTAARHPGLTVVVDHLGNPPDLRTAAAGEWYRDIEHAAASPDVVVKISGLLTQQHGVPPQQVAHMVRHVVDALGPGRCLIGSDWPICLPRGSRADSLATSRLGLAHLTDHQRDQVLRTTAVRVYALDG